MKNQVIKVLNEEHGKKVIEYWNSRDVDTTGYEGDCTEEDGDWIYYGIINNKFDNYLLSDVKRYNAEIIELPKENQYPKVMWVWDDVFDSNLKRVVFMEKCGKYLAWRYSETIEDSLSEYRVDAWKFAKDIVEEIVVELTLEDISAGKGVGVPVHLLRIKK